MKFFTAVKKISFYSLNELGSNHLLGLPGQPGADFPIYAKVREERLNRIIVFGNINMLGWDGLGSTIGTNVV